MAPDLKNGIRKTYVRPRLFETAEALRPTAMTQVSHVIAETEEAQAVYESLPTDVQETVAQAFAPRS